MLTRNIPVITRGISDLAREKRIRVQNKIKVMQHQSATEHIKENMFINQPARTTINRNSPVLPTNQNLHVIPEENGMLNVPNLGK